MTYHYKPQGGPAKHVRSGGHRARMNRAAESIAKQANEPPEENTTEPEENTEEPTSTASPRTISRPNLPAPKGSAQLVLILSVTLFLFVEWKNVVYPVIQTIWNGSSLPTVNVRPTLGMLVAIVIMVGFSQFSDDAAGFILMILSAMWIVFLVESPSGTITAFFDWFHGSSQQQYQPGVSSPQPNVINVPAH